MQVQSGILANVQYSPSGWQLVPLFFFLILSLPLSQEQLCFLGLWHFQGRCYRLSACPLHCTSLWHTSPCGRMGDMAAHAVPRRHTLPCCVTVCSFSKHVPHLLLTMAMAWFGAVTLGGDQEDSHPISLGSSIPSSRVMTDYVVSA